MVKRICLRVVSLDSVIFKLCFPCFASLGMESKMSWLVRALSRDNHRQIAKSSWWQPAQCSLSCCSLGNVMNHSLQTTRFAKQWCCGNQLNITLIPWIIKENCLYIFINSFLWGGLCHERLSPSWQTSKVGCIENLKSFSSTSHKWVTWNINRYISSAASSHRSQRRKFPLPVNYFRCRATTLTPKKPSKEKSCKKFPSDESFLSFAFHPRTWKNVTCAGKIIVCDRIKCSVLKIFLRLIIFLMWCYVRNMFSLWQFRS